MDKCDIKKCIFFKQNLSRCKGNSRFDCFKYTSTKIKTLEQELERCRRALEDQVVKTSTAQGLYCLHKKALEDEKSKSVTDKMFIVELINDLHRNGFSRGTKSYQMLHDWSAELRENCRKNFCASRLKEKFNELIGEDLW